MMKSPKDLSPASLCTHIEFIRSESFVITDGYHHPETMGSNPDRIICIACQKIQGHYGNDSLFFLTLTVPVTTIDALQHFETE